MPASHECFPNGDCALLFQNTSGTRMLFVSFVSLRVPFGALATMTQWHSQISRSLHTYAWITADININSFILEEAQKGFREILEHKVQETWG